MLKKRPVESIVERFDQISRSALCTSSVVAVDLRFGIKRIKGGSALWQRIERDLLPRVEILSLGAEEALLNDPDWSQ